MQKEFKEKKLVKWGLTVIVALILVTIFLWENLTWPAVNITPWVGTNDFTDAHYPTRYFNNKYISNFKIPTWISDMSCGYPAYYSAILLHPVNFVSAFFDMPVSALIVMFINYLLFFISSFIFFRLNRLGFIGAAFGAMIVAFSGFAANSIIYPEILTSFYLFIFELIVIELMIQKKKMMLAKSLALGFLIGFSLMTGHPQITFYGTLFVIAYWVINWLMMGRKIGPLVFYGLVAGVMVLGISASQTLPTIEFVRSSTRAQGLSKEAINRYKFPLKDLKTFVLPFSNIDRSQGLQAFSRNGWPTDDRYVYLGIVGLAMAILGMVRFNKWRRSGLLFLGATVLGFLLSLGDQLTLGFLFTVPPFSFFRLPFKNLFLVSFFLGGFAGFGFETIIGWLKKLKLGSVVVWTAAAILFVVSLFDLKVNAQKLHPPVDTDKYYKEPEAVGFLKGRLQNQERVTNQQYFYPSAKIFLEKPELWENSETISNLRNLLPVFTNLMYEIPMNTGAANGAGLKITRYNELESEIFFKGLKYLPDGTVEMSESAAFLNRLMGVRFLVSAMPVKHHIISKAHEIKFENGQDPILVYEFFDYFPRLLMVPKAEKAEPEKIMEHLLAVDFDPKQKVFIEEDTDWGAKGGYAATAKFLSYEDQEVEVETQASSDGFLFLSDTYYPGWKAYVDGNDAKIYLANYAFRAVPVPGGNHKVVFRFEPESYQMGLKITAVSFAVLLILFLISMVYERKDIKLRRKR